MCIECEREIEKKRGIWNIFLHDCMSKSDDAFIFFVCAFLRTCGPFSLSTKYNNSISSFGIVLLDDTKKSNKARDTAKSTFDYHKRRLS